MYDLTVEKNGKGETLVFSDKVLKEDIRELKDMLLKVIDRTKTLKIEFKNFQKTDIFFVQLLCAAHKYAFSKKKDIKIPMIPDVLKKVLLENGLYREKGCINCNDQGCFWLREVIDA